MDSGAPTAQRASTPEAATEQHHSSTQRTPIRDRDSDRGGDQHMEGGAAADSDRGTGAASGAGPRHEGKPDAGALVWTGGTEGSRSFWRRRRDARQAKRAQAEEERRGHATNTLISSEGAAEGGKGSPGTVPGSHLSLIHI